MRRTRIPISGWVLLHACAIAGCASGVGHVESLMRGINTMDALAVGGAALLLHELGPGWSANVVQGTKQRRYRITVVRFPWPAGGEGEFATRFSLEAKRVATENACNGFRVLAYSERYEVSNVFFTHRVGEGEIECLEGPIEKAEKAVARPFLESPIPVKVLPETSLREGFSGDP